MFLLNLLPGLLTLQLKLKLVHTTLQLRHTPSPSWFSNHLPSHFSCSNCSSLSVSSLCICSSCRLLSRFLFSNAVPPRVANTRSFCRILGGRGAAVRPSLGLSWGCSPGSEARSPAASSSSSSSSASSSSAGPPGKKLRAATALRPQPRQAAKRSRRSSAWRVLKRGR